MRDPYTGESGKWYDVGGIFDGAVGVMTKFVAFKQASIPNPKVWYTGIDFKDFTIVRCPLLKFSQVLFVKLLTHRIMKVFCPQVFSGLTRLSLFSICAFLTFETYAQTKETIKNDGLLPTSPLDSLSAQIFQSYTSIKHQYDSIEQKLNSLTLAIQNKADSLGRIGVSSDHLLQKIDGVGRHKAAKLTALKNKFDSLKAATISKINKLNLPPELKTEVDEYAGLLNKLDLSMPITDLKLQALSLNSNLSITNLNNPFGENIPNLYASNVPVVEKIANAKSQLQGLNQSIPKDIPTVDQLGKVAETQLGQLNEVSAVQDLLGDLPTAPITSEEHAKQELLKHAQEAAVDHFAGKEQELKSAMGEISKYKKKFHNVNNLEELAALIKKRPNEMRGKPLIERIVPGIAFQIQKKDDLLFVDFNPYLGYRFTGRLTAGAGWNERVSYNLNDNQFESESRIYGPRAFGEFKLWRGFSPRLEVESMNTFVPPYIKASPADVGQREWVWGVFAGIKKDYKFFKKINGTALLMFRLFDPDRKSPYADVVNARFGFEFPMKKKVKTPK